MFRDTNRPKINMSKKEGKKRIITVILTSTLSLSPVGGSLQQYTLTYRLSTIIISSTRQFQCYIDVIYEKNWKELQGSPL